MSCFSCRVISRCLSGCSKGFPAPTKKWISAIPKTRPAVGFDAGCAAGRGGAPSHHSLCRRCSSMSASSALASVGSPRVARSSPFCSPWMRLRMLIESAWMSRARCAGTISPRGCGRAPIGFARSTTSGSSLPRLVSGERSVNATFRAQSLINASAKSICGAVISERNAAWNNTICTYVSATLENPPSPSSESFTRSAPYPPWSASRYCWCSRVQSCGSKRRYTIA